MNMIFGAVKGSKIAGIDKFFDFFDKIDPIMTVFLAIINLVLVIKVFKFTQKMSHSKLSLSPEIDFRYDYQMNSEAEWKFGTALAYREEGFPLEDSHTHKNLETLYIRVKNRGDLPSTKIKIRMKMKVYKTEITGSFIGSEGQEHFKHKRKLHEIRDIEIKVDYMGADEEKLYGIVSLHGQVREMELVLIEISSNGYTYFKGEDKNPTVLHHYYYPYLKGAWSTKNGGKSVYGHIDAWEEFGRKQKRFQGETDYYAERAREDAEYMLELEEDEERRRQQEEARFRGEIE